MALRLGAIYGTYVNKCMLSLWSINCNIQIRGNFFRFDFGSNVFFFSFHERVDFTFLQYLCRPVSFQRYGGGGHIFDDQILALFFYHLAGVDQNFLLNYI